MQLAFTTYSTPQWSLERIAEQGAALGYQAVELRMYDGHDVPADLTQAQCAEVRRTFTSRGLPICAVGTSCRFSGPDEARMNQVASARQYIAIAAAMGAPILRVFGGAYEAGVSPQQAAGRVAAALSELADAAAASGVRLALETHDAFAAAALVGQVMRQVVHPAVGACWDWLHPFRVGETASEAFAHLRGRILHTHTKDARKDAEGRWEAAPLGKGDLPLREILAALVSSGYDGPLSLEWEPRGHDSHPETALAQYAEAMRALCAEVGARLG